MRLESAQIRGFRSIRAAELLDCGNFNVLIGKNNAGKSNVLSSISNFFTCVRGGEIVELNPPAGLELDFFDRNTSSPITTKLVFSMGADEWEGLKADLASEAPQMKHAVETIGPSLRLAVTVSITNQPSPFAYVSLAELESGGASRTVLFAVDDKAARELYRRGERITRDVSEINGLRQLTSRFDADDWQRLLSTGGSERPPLKSLFRRSPFYRRVDVSDETLDKVDTLISSRPTYEEFVAALKGISVQLQNDADTVEASPLTEKVRTFAGDADSIPKYVLNLIGRIARMKVLHLRELRRQIGKEEAARLLSLKVKRGGRNVLNRIEQMIQNLLGVQVDAFESDARAPRGGEVNAELDVDNFLVEVNGSGIRESLRLILDIEFESPNILLVEEPEVHLHPALETSMMQYLRSLASERQVFISTHSTNFLDTAQVRNVYLVSKENGSTLIKLLDQEEAEERLPRELGIRLSSIFLFDRLLLVEGPSDEDIIRTLAGIMNINFSTANVGFIPIGGVRNMHYFASAATISFLTKRQVRITILVDRDEREQADVKKLAEALGARAILKVLNQREIENYLVSPKALGKFIAFKQKLTGSQALVKEPSISNLDQDIAACLLELKPLAISHRVIKELCHPVFIRPDSNYPEGIGTAIRNECDRAIAQIEEAKARAEGVEAAASQYVEENWKGCARSLVPGSALLDRVCQRYGVRFKKDPDGARLASMMEETEIADEIKNIIADLSG